MHIGKAVQLTEEIVRMMLRNDNSCRIVCLLSVEMAIMLIGCGGESDSHPLGQEIVIDCNPSSFPEEMEELQKVEDCTLVAIQYWEYFLRPVGNARYIDVTKEEWRKDYPDTGVPAIGCVINVWGEAVSIIPAVHYALETFNPQAQRTEIVTRTLQDGTFMDALVAGCARVSKASEEGHEEQTESSRRLGLRIVYMNYGNADTAVSIAASCFEKDAVSGRYVGVSVPDRVRQRLEWLFASGPAAFPVGKVTVSEGGSFCSHIPLMSTQLKNNAITAVLRSEAGVIYGHCTGVVPQKLPSEPWYFDAVGLGPISSWYADSSVGGFFVSAATRCIKLFEPGEISDVEKNFLWKKAD
jgi:hypothetical protein